MNEHAVRDLGYKVKLAILAIAALLLFAPQLLNAPGLEKGMTYTLLALSLIIPTIVVSLVLMAAKDSVQKDNRARAVVKEVTGSDLKTLVKFLSNPRHYDEWDLRVSADDLESIRQHLIKIAPDELLTNLVPEAILLGLQFSPNPTVLSDVPGFNLDADWAKLYLTAKNHTHFQTETKAFYFRQRDRVATAIATKGFTAWQEELKAEHPAFQEVAWGHSFFEDRFKEFFPHKVDHNISSKTLGSFPMLALIEINSRYLEINGMNWDRFKRENEGWPSRFKSKEALDLIKSRGLDFTDEELRDPSLVRFLKEMED